MMKKLLEWLRRPHGWLLFAVYVVTAISATVAILCMVYLQDTNYSFISYIVYFIAALTLGYSVYTVVILAPSAKRKIIALLKKNNFTSNLMEHYDFRTITFAVFSFVISIGYAVFNGIIGIIYSSIWYGALASYYLVLAVMRGDVIFFHRKKHKLKNNSIEEDNIRAVKTFRRCGIGLVFLPICLSFVILQMVLGYNSFEHSSMMIYAAAAYAFYKITMSVINLVKARRHDDVTLRAVRSINLADAMVSILALQTAMLKEFSTGQEAGAANALTGGVVCALTLALGIYMIVYANKKYKLIKNVD